MSNNIELPPLVDANGTEIKFGDIVAGGPDDNYNPGTRRCGIVYEVVPAYRLVRFLETSMTRLDSQFGNCGCYHAYAEECEVIGHIEMEADYVG